MRTSLKVLLSVAVFIASPALAGESLLSAPAGADKAAAAEMAAGVKAYKGGDTKAAIEHFKKAAGADPNMAEAHFNLAMVLHWSGNHGDATKHFGHAKKLGANNPAIAGSQTLNGHVR